MIADYLPGANVLDAYAGSGALGIEALSRGASYAMFVEKAARVAQVIRKNLADLNLVEMSDVYVQDIEVFSPTEKFDVIIADPPYDSFEVCEIDSLANFLKKSGVLVLSHPSDAPRIKGLRLEKTHRYAAARISIYTR